MMGLSSSLGVVFPNLSAMVPKIKFADPKAVKSVSFKGLFERDSKEWEYVSINEPRANRPYMHRLEAYDTTRWDSPHDYSTDSDISYVVPELN